MSSEMLSARSPILALIISGHLIKHTQAINGLIGWEFTSRVSIYNNVIPVSPVCSHGRSRSRGHRHAHLIAPSDHSALITVLIMGITLLHIRPFIASFNSQRLTPPACKKLPVRPEVGAPQNWSADCEREMRPRDKSALASDFQIDLRPITPSASHIAQFLLRVEVD